MSGYFQTIGGVLIAVILIVLLSRFGKDVSVLLSVAVCCMVLLGVVYFLRPILHWLQQLVQLSGISEEWMGILLKTIGVALIGQIAALVCTDSGNAAMAKAVELLTTAAILYLSLPLMQALMELIQKMAGEA